MNEARISRAAWVGLGVLTFINLFNYLDRYVVAALVESLKKSELQINDSQAGWLMTGFILVYMVTSPFFGTLGDRFSRTKLIAFGVGVWSLATALGGLAHSFHMLFLARSAVGIGEAAYGTIAPALIADYFPKAQRGRAFAIFFMAIPVGSALGYILGGLVDSHWGWRPAFYVAGLPGLLLAAITLFLVDPPRGSQDEEPAPAVKDQGIVATYLGLLKNRLFLLSVLGYGAYTFALGGLAFWMPAFLERVRHMSKSDATVQFGAIVVVTGFLGTFAGGWIGDRLLKRYRQAYLWLCGVTVLLAAPLALLAVTTSNHVVFLAALVAAELLLFASTGPVNSAIVDVVPATQRATAVALSIFVMHMLGDVPSPPLIGMISDVRHSLTTALMIVPAAMVVAGYIWLWAAWTGERTPSKSV
jgi:predicted MFS family arabinose efflux permease